VPVLVVGGGMIAARKVRGLLDAGATVTVIAPSIVDELRAVPHHERAYAAGDLDGRRLAIVATDDPTVNARVAADATAAGIWVNAADDPANCTFILPAIARRHPLTVAVSSGGASPAMASFVRERIAAEVLTERLAEVAVGIAAERAEVQAKGGSTEDVDWRTAIVERLKTGADT
jgi:precorrin-2 dehydrogenase / sirohydrochlorin ferrochelatase